MEEQQHSLDEIFRQSLGDYREAPPAAAWEKVAARLDEDERKRRGFFWPWPWIVLILLLTIGGGWFLAARYQTHQANDQTGQEFMASRGGESGGATGTASDVNDRVKDQKDQKEESAISNQSSLAPNSVQKNQKQSLDAKASTEHGPGIDKGSTPESKHSKQTKHSAKNNSESVVEDGVSSSASGNISLAKADHSAKISGSSGAKKGGMQFDDPAGNESVNEANQTSTKTRAANTSNKNQKAKTNSLPLVPALTSEESPAIPEKTPTSNTKASDKKPQKNTPASGNAKAKSIEGAQTQAAETFAATSNSKTIADPKKQNKKPTSTAKTQVPASPDAAGNPASKPSAGATPATSSSARTGDENLPALAKTEPTAKSTQRKPATSMTASSPSFEESKEKDELYVPEPAAAPIAAAEAKKETETSKETASASAADSSAKGGEGAGSGEPKARTKPSFSLALQGGFEFPLQKAAPNQVSGGFRLLWHFDQGISVGIQPSIRYGNVSTNGTPSQTYQQSSPVTVDSLVTMDSTGKVSQRIYIPQQTFDSIIVAGISAGGPIWQIEIPIILNYKFGKGWFAYGGPSLTLGGKIDHQSGDIQKYTINRIDSVTGPSGSVVQPPRPSSSFENYFGTSNLPEFSTYQPSSNEWKDPMSVRWGYLIGLGYERKRLMFDVSLHQQISGYSDVMQPYQKVYSTPYVRIGVGWKLIPERGKK